MMKAIFPCSYYLPETAASLYITDNIVHACADKGIEVDLYTPSPTRNVPDGSVWEREERQMDGKLRIHRFHLYLRPSTLHHIEESAHIFVVMGGIQNSKDEPLAADYR